jgi:iron(III) transport system ATP-binding protein
MTGLAINNLHKSYGSHPVLTGVHLEAPAGSLTAILGASGSGKTTLLRLLAGFERPDQGTIRIGERTVDAGGKHLRPELRRIGYVPQEGSLFPHLTVEANIGFALPRKLRRQRANELLEFVGLSGLNRRHPHQLSGGQQQRVALARALAIDPEVVLLDEPFASLDAHLRTSVREEVREILRRAGTTAILVTHDQEEALSLADLIAVLRDGTIAQYATPYDIYTAPVDEGLARFIGNANLLRGTLESTVVITALGAVPVADHGELPLGSEVTVLLRPEQIQVRRLVSAEAAAIGELGGTIVSNRYLGHDTILYIQAKSPESEAPLIVRAASDPELTPGTEVGLTIEGAALIWPDGAGGHRGKTSGRHGHDREPS